MPSLQSEARELIQATLDLLEECKKTSVLASEQDYSDFRSWAKRSEAPPKKAEIVPPKPLEKEFPKPAAPLPKKKEEPPLPAPPKIEMPPPEEKPPVLEDPFLDVRKVWGKIHRFNPFTSAMALHTELSIHKVAYDLLDVITDLVRNMPRDFKQSLGAKLRDEAIEILTEERHVPTHFILDNRLADATPHIS